MIYKNCLKMELITHDSLKELFEVYDKYTSSITYCDVTDISNFIYLYGEEIEDGFWKTNWKELDALVIYWESDEEDTLHVHTLSSKAIFDYLHALYAKL